ncbi:MAG: hypothetical protein WBK10_08420 [Bacillota bacterium]|jgi:hypothetical protein|nr:hypothetical protein [Bacillota bacterium]
MIPWSAEERQLIQTLAVDACAAGNCETGAMYLKLLVADRAWRVYGECADLERLQDMDLRDVVMNEAWRGSEVMERCISELADSLATPVAYDPDPR